MILTKNIGRSLSLSFVEFVYFGTSCRELPKTSSGFNIPFFLSLSLFFSLDSRASFVLPYFIKMNDINKGRQGQEALLKVLIIILPCLAVLSFVFSSLLLLPLASSELLPFACFAFQFLSASSVFLFSSILLVPFFHDRYHFYFL